MAIIQNGRPLANSPAPAYEAVGVLAQIEAQAAKLQDLFAEVQALVAQLQALTPPSMAGRGANESEASFRARVSDFNARLHAFEQQVQQLNTRLGALYQKIGAAQLALARLQSQDLPAAQRRAAERVERELKNSVATLNAVMESVTAGASAAATEDASLGQLEQRAELRRRTVALVARTAAEPDVTTVLQATLLFIWQAPPTRPASSKLLSVPPGGLLLPTGSL
jgi:Skp family chaperone for outer membrane proteins